jgi:hypothetical protein
MSKVINLLPALTQKSDGAVNNSGAYCTNSGFFCCGIEIGGGGGAQNLAGVLSCGNCAGTFDLNMNDQDLLNLNRLVGSVGQSISYEACEHNFNEDIVMAVNKAVRSYDLCSSNCIASACLTNTGGICSEANICGQNILASSCVCSSLVCGNDICATNFYGDGSNLTGVSASDPTKLPLAGGTMTGGINMGTNALTNVTNVTSTLNQHLTLNPNGCCIQAQGPLQMNSFTICGIDTLGTSTLAGDVGDLNIVSGVNMCGNTFCGASIIDAGGVNVTTGLISGECVSGCLYGDGSNITGISAADPTKLPLAGGTMSGAINMGDQDLTNLNRLVSSVGQAISYEACQHNFNNNIILAANKQVCAEDIIAVNCIQGTCLIAGQCVAGGNACFGGNVNMPNNVCIATLRIQGCVVGNGNMFCDISCVLATNVCASCFTVAGGGAGASGTFTSVTVCQGIVISGT